METPPPAHETGKQGKHVEPYWEDCHLYWRQRPSSHIPYCDPPTTKTIVYADLVKSDGSFLQRIAVGVWGETEKKRIFAPMKDYSEVISFSQYGQVRLPSDLPEEFKQDLEEKMHNDFKNIRPRKGP